MDEHADLTRWARSFGPVAAAYDRGRPGYPREAAAWLVGRDRAQVLELGAGTGKLTAELVALGHDVHATDPDEAMLAILTERVPEARTSVAAAEELPLADRSVDVVVAAQAFHWFDLDRALPEIARVLRPGGHLSLVWNQRDERIPWVKRLGRLIGTQEQESDPAQPLVESGRFGFVEEQQFQIWQDVNRESILDLVRSRSNVAVLDHEAREAKLAEVLAFYDDYGRGMDGMQLPYVTQCFRATVLGSPGADDGAEHAEGAAEGDREATPRPGDEPGPSDGSDTDLLLIDFR
ncbi:class I SAM-dependent methyltransferase [Nocardioides sp.]|uniref:class I SAM-dependent methyltransferase n=1 Tax=Nocardioides sp. TaxID=35761 RepID=UPI0035272C05